MPGVFGTFGQKDAPEPANELVPVLAFVLDAFAYELGERENDALGLATAVEADDSQIVAFRRGLVAVREGEGWVSERVIHLERRMARAYQEIFLAPLPALHDHDGVPLSWLLWNAMKKDD